MQIAVIPRLNDGVLTLPASPIYAEAIPNPFDTTKQAAMFEHSRVEAALLALMVLLHKYFGGSITSFSSHNARKKLQEIKQQSKKYGRDAVTDWYSEAIVGEKSMQERGKRSN